MNWAEASGRVGFFHAHISTCVEFYGVFMRFVMGKFKSKRAGGVKPSRNVPLSEQLLEEQSVRPPGREKQRRRREDDDDVCSCYRSSSFNTVQCAL